MIFISYHSLQSLTSGELGSLSGSEGCNRCRVILPDLSNSVVAVRPGESIQVLLTRLLERRGISYSTFDVYQHKSDKVLTYNLTTYDNFFIYDLTVYLMCFSHFFHCAACVYLL